MATSRRSATCCCSWTRPGSTIKEGAHGTSADAIVLGALSGVAASFTIAGAQTFTAALAAVREKSDSQVGVVGYSGAVAVAQVALTTFGTVIVLLMA